MWRINYLNLNNDEVEQKGDFNSDKEAIEWIGNNKHIIALKLLVGANIYRVIEL